MKGPLRGAKQEEQGTLFTEDYPATQRPNHWETLGEQRRFMAMRQQQQNNLEMQYSRRPESRDD